MSIFSKNKERMAELTEEKKLLDENVKVDKKDRRAILLAAYSVFLPAALFVIVVFGLLIALLTFIF